MFSAQPRAFRDPQKVTERRAMLRTSAVTAPLNAWAEQVSRRRNEFRKRSFVPSFDPAEAGTRARVLILGECPRASSVRRAGFSGSGFNSVDNDDSTAENLWKTRALVGLDDWTVKAEIVPWFLGAESIHPNTGQIAQGAQEISGLLRLFPELRAVVVCGVFANVGWTKHVEPELHNTRFETIKTWHPSPQSLGQRGKHDHFIKSFERAQTLAYEHD